MERSNPTTANSCSQFAPFENVTAGFTVSFDTYKHHVITIIHLLYRSMRIFRTGGIVPKKNLELVLPALTALTTHIGICNLL